MVESYKIVRVQWYWQPAVTTSTSNRGRVPLHPPVSNEGGSSGDKNVLSRPWGSRVEFVQGELGNLRLINVSIDDAGQYSCEAYYPARLPAVVYMLKVRGEILHNCMNIYSFLSCLNIGGSQGFTLLIKMSTQRYDLDDECLACEIWRFFS